jgi:hypothetical protein
MTHFYCLNAQVCALSDPQIDDVYNPLVHISCQQPLQVFQVRKSACRILKITANDHRLLFLPTDTGSMMFMLGFRWT